MKNLYTRSWARLLLLKVALVVLARPACGVFNGTFYKGSVKYVPGQLLVGVQAKAAAISDKTSSVSTLGLAKAAFSSLGIKVVDRVTEDVVLVQVSDDKISEIQKKLEAAPGVMWVEKNLIVRAQASTIKRTLPNDPEFASLWGMKQVMAPEAWRMSKGSKAVRVCVADSGVSASHPDLKTAYTDVKLWYDTINNESKPYDDFNHGTHCAGVIGATANNRVGVAGMAWEVDLISCKFLDEYGDGTIDNAIKCIDFCTDNKALIQSHSWGISGLKEPHKGVQAAIKRLQRKGGMFVAAAGNDGTSVDIYPASDPNPIVLSVASTTPHDVLSHFSNWGRPATDIAAPGSGILSTVPSGYDEMDGTSMATPHVAGAAALIKAKYPTLKGRAIKRRLMASVDKMPSLQGKVISGGRLNVFKALGGMGVQPYVATVKFTVTLYSPDGIALSRGGTWKHTDGKYEWAFRNTAKAKAFGNKVSFWMASIECKGYDCNQAISELRVTFWKLPMYRGPRQAYRAGVPTSDYCYYNTGEEHSCNMYGGSVDENGNVWGSYKVYLGGAMPTPVSSKTISSSSSSSVGKSIEALPLRHANMTLPAPPPGPLVLLKGKAV